MATQELSGTAMCNQNDCPQEIQQIIEGSLSLNFRYDNCVR